MKFVKGIEVDELLRNIVPKRNGRTMSPMCERIFELMKTEEIIRVDCKDEEETYYAYRQAYAFNALKGAPYIVSKYKNSFYVMRRTYEQAVFNR